MSTGVLITYDNGNRVPDVMATVLMLSPTETPMLSGFRKTIATNTLHEWQVQTNDTKNDNAVIEGAAYGTASNSVPTRPNNVTQLFEKVYQVSSTEQAVNSYHASKGKQLPYQQMLAMKNIATDIELALVRGSQATGNASTARRMGGLENFITTNGTAVLSGVKLSESLFNDAIEQVYEEDSNNVGAPAGTVDEVYVPARLKRVISNYTAGNTKNIEATDKRLVNSVDVYESDFGVQKIFLSRYVSKSTTTGTVLFVGRAQNAVAFLQPIADKPESAVAQTGHSTKGVIAAECTLECNEAWQSKLTNVSLAFN